MEKSTSDDKMPDHEFGNEACREGIQEGEAPNAQKLWSPLFFTAAIGMALFWSCFFTMLMRNSFMDGDIDQLWYHLYLRMVFFLGAGAVCLVAAKASDFAASERGHRILTGGVCLLSVVAAVSSFTAFSFGLTMPLAFDLVAWSLAGAGLACLLLLWMEVVASFGRPFLPCCLAVSAALGGVAYLVLDLLPFPFNIGLLCVSPLLSLGVIKMVEQDASVVPAAFVPLAESRKRARLAPAYLAISAAYGIVFGLGIGSTTQIPGEEALYADVAVFLLLGSGTAYAFLMRFANHALQTDSLRIMFPVLIIALIPMSFLHGLAYTACNLLLLSCYVFFEIVGLDASISLARERGASPVHLVATSQAVLYLGLLLGHAIGLLASVSGVVNYAMLSTAALGLVVLLAVFITFAPVAPLASVPEPETEAEPERHEQGHWRARCAAVAREAGLSARETEVFMLLAKGRGIEHIQNKLYISGHTVKTHTYNIYKKMGISSREELLDAIEGISLDEESPAET